jgi:methionyl-tRNA formyltransferase
MPNDLRLVMLGTGDFALPTFDHLADQGHTLVALITQPDRPQGRRQELIPSAIKLAARARGVPVHQPERINAPEGVELLRKLRPDLLVTAAYGQILSAEVLSVPRHGGINLHGSILPAYRGAAPVARAIERGETETGVTVIAMSPKVDAGGMIAFARTPIDADETAGELEKRLAPLGAPLVARTIEDLAAGKAIVLPQDPSKATKAPKLSKDDGRIDWSRSALDVHNLVRAMQPWPTASTNWHSSSGRDLLRVIIHRTRVEVGTGEPGQVIVAGRDRLVVAAGHDAIQLLRIQLPGKRAVAIDEFLRGHRVALGDRMGD